MDLQLYYKLSWTLLSCLILASPSLDKACDTTPPHPTPPPLWHYVTLRQTHTPTPSIRHVFCVWLWAFCNIYQQIMLQIVPSTHNHTRQDANHRVVQNGLIINSYSFIFLTHLFYNKELQHLNKNCTRTFAAWNHS